MLNGLQITSSDSGCKLLSDSLSLFGGEATFHLMGPSVMIWIPLYCHLKWRFVCFLSAQDVLDESRGGVTIVSADKKRKCAVTG